MPSPPTRSPTHDATQSISDLYRKKATKVDTIEKVASSAATSPAIRETSRPGKERKVTDALKTIAAFRRVFNYENAKKNEYSPQDKYSRQVKSLEQRYVS